jgi:diketogulonate reductase-like aldo/keto reductase
MHETVAALEKLVTAGKIRSYGVSNWTCEQMRLGHRHGSFATVQPPYSLLRRDVEADVLPYCQSHNMGVLVYSPLADLPTMGFDFDWNNDGVLDLPAGAVIVDSIAINDGGSGDMLYGGTNFQAAFVADSIRSFLLSNIETPA